MKTVETLPDGYSEIYSINLQKDKKLSLLVNLFAILISIVMILPMHYIIPIYSLYNMESESQNTTLRLVILLILMIAYIILHELVHGIAMKICGTKKVKYGFTGMYAFAGSDDYYDKKSYIFIALAPIVFWGIVIAIINLFVPVEWFWIIYFIQIFNISGATGDLFVTIKFSRLPNDILIKDYGVGMTVYSKTKTV